MANKLSINIIFFLLLFGVIKVNAQQLPYSDQYLLNKYSLSPTFAGYSGYSEVFLNYRNDLTKISGGPSTFNASGFGNVSKDKFWIGGDIMTDKAGIMSVFKASVSFTYKLQVDYDQHIFFGIWPIFYQASINTANGIGIDPNDPVIQNAGKINSSAFNAGFGINYSWNDFNIGISMPTAFGSNDEYVSNSSFKYKVQRQFQVHSSYLFHLNNLWQLQAMGVYRKTSNQPATIELSLMSIYQGRFWGGLLYRNSGVLAVNLGGHIYNGFVLGYAYEIGLSNINNGSGGSHEITLGYRFGFTDISFFSNKKDAGRQNKNGRGKRKGRAPALKYYPEVKDFNLKRN